MWKKKLDELLPLFGHRNWIVIADKAFPLQTATGITMLDTGEPLSVVLNHTLEKIDAATHLKPVVTLDQELDHMTNDLIMDVDKICREIKITVIRATNEQPRVIPHEEALKELDAASKLFQVLVLKTESLIPYTSVFIELDCGYWEERKEMQLRKQMESE